VMLLAERDVRRRMRRFQGDGVTAAVGHGVAELSRSVVPPKDQ
jgi:predicted amidohydrolase